MRLAKRLNVLLAFSVLVVFFAVPEISMPTIVDGLQTGKFIVFVYLLTLILSICAVRSLFLRPFIIRITIPDLLIIVMFAFISINRYLINDNPNFSIRFLELTGLAILYFILRQAGKLSIDMALSGILCAGLVQSIIGSLQIVGIYTSNNPNFTLTGCFYNPGPYAGYIVSTFPIIIGACLYWSDLGSLLLKNKSGSSFPGLLSRSYSRTCNRLLYVPFFIIAVMLLVIILSESRAALIALLASGGYLLSFRYGYFSNLASGYRQMKNVVYGSVIMIALFIVFSGIYSLRKASANGRLLIWKVTSHMIIDHPLTGVGYDKFQSAYMDFQSSYFSKGMVNQEVENADDIIYPFNETLLFVAENGIPAALLLFFLFVVLLSSGVKSIKGCIVKAGIIAILVFAQFSYPSQILPIKMNLCLFMAVLATEYRKEVWIIALHRRVLTTLTTSFCIGAGTIIAILIPKLKNIEEAFKSWGLGAAYYQSENYVQSITFYQRAYDAMSRDGTFLTQYAKVLSNDKQYQASLRLLLKAKDFSSNSVMELIMGDDYQGLGNYLAAEQAYKTAYLMVPNKFYPLYLLAKLYKETGQNSKAVLVACQILKKRAKIKNKAMEEIMFDVKRILNDCNNY